jgi:hypothetical protein
MTASGSVRLVTNAKCRQSGHSVANELVRTRDADTGQQLASFSFDQDGERTSQQEAGATDATAYHYDQAGHLTSYHAPARHASDPSVDRGYAYDGDGLRADLLWDDSGQLPLIIGDADGLYITGPDGLPITQLTFDAQQRYYHHDQLGSTRAITNPDGTLLARYDYDPIGNPTTGSSAIDGCFGDFGRCENACFNAGPSGWSYGLRGEERARHCQQGGPHHHDARNGLGRSQEETVMVPPRQEGLSFRSDRVASGDGGAPRA